MRVIELLEVRQSLLYHHMDSVKAENVFRSNKMEARWGHNIIDNQFNPRQNVNRSYGYRGQQRDNQVISRSKIPKIFRRKVEHRVWGNSFTRTKNNPWLSGLVVIIVDQNKIAQTNKIIPVNGEMLFKGKYNASANQGFMDRELAEEFVIGDIKNLNRVLVDIQINRNLDTDLKNLIQNYAAQYHIPLSFIQR